MALFIRVRLVLHPYGQAKDLVSFFFNKSTVDTIDNNHNNKSNNDIHIGGKALTYITKSKKSIIVVQDRKQYLRWVLLKKAPFIVLVEYNFKALQLSLRELHN